LRACAQDEVQKELQEKNAEMNECIKAIEQALSNNNQGINQDLPSKKSWIIDENVSEVITSIDYISKEKENFKVKGLYKRLHYAHAAYCQTSDNRLFISGGTN